MANQINITIVETNPVNPVVDGMKLKVDAGLFTTLNSNATAGDEYGSESVTPGDGYALFIAGNTNFSLTTIPADGVPTGNYEIYTTTDGGFSWTKQSECDNMVIVNNDLATIIDGLITKVLLTDNNDIIARLGGIPTRLNIPDGYVLANDGGTLAAKTFAELKALLPLNNVTNDAQAKASDMIDEDDMVSDLDTKFPTQQSVKAYVDSLHALCLLLSGGQMSGNIGMGDNKITDLATPVDQDDATRKIYVDSLHALCLLASDLLDEDDMASNSAIKPASQQSVKAYVDSLHALCLLLAGGTMSGAIAMGTNRITGLGDPVDDQDAVTKKHLNDLLDSVSGETCNLGVPANMSTQTTQFYVPFFSIDAVGFYVFQYMLFHPDTSIDDPVVWSSPQEAILSINNTNSILYGNLPAEGDSKYNDDGNIRMIYRARFQGQINNTDWTNTGDVLLNESHDWTIEEIAEEINNETFQTAIAALLSVNPTFTNTVQ